MLKKKKKVEEEIKPVPQPQPMRPITLHVNECECGKIQLVGNMEDMQILFKWRHQNY